MRSSDERILITAISDSSVLILNKMEDCSEQINFCLYRFFSIVSFVVWWFLVLIVTVMLIWRFFKLFHVFGYYKLFFCLLYCLVAFSKTSKEFFVTF